MFIPKNEMGVVVLFAQQAHMAEAEIIDIRSAFPDMIVEKAGHRFRAEMEYWASNFVQHGHDPLGCDIIICWQNDLMEYALPIVELSDPDWHTKEWTHVHQKDKEILRLKSEIDRLQCILYGDGLKAKTEASLDKANEQRQDEKISAQKRMLAIFRHDPNASLRTVGKQIGRSPSTVSSWLDELESAGTIHRNGQGVEIR